MKFIPYNFITQRYTGMTKITVDPRCNGVMVTNVGTTVAHVNDFPIHPGVPGTNNGEAFIAGGNACEIYQDVLQIRFPGGPNAGNAVIVVQKVYITGGDER